MEPMEMTKIILGKNMKALRKAKGWNQEDLAEKANYSTGFIKDIERGKSWVSPEALESIADAFKVSIDRLFDPGNREEKISVLPMSHSLKMALNVPDEIYSLAAELGDSSDEVWGDIEKELLIRIEQLKITTKKA